MNRRLIPLIAAAALSMLAAVPVAGEDNETFSPRQCVDILSGGGQLWPDGSTYDLTFALQVDGRCGGALFTLNVFDEDCTTVTAVPLATLTTRGTSATGNVAFAADNVDPDGEVWVYATSSFGGTVYDTAPDAGCIVVDAFPPAGGKFN